VLVVEALIGIRKEKMKKEQNIAIVKEINPIVRKVESLEITSKEEMSEGVVMLSQLNKFNDHIETEKEKLTIPLNTALREIRARYKPIETTLSESILTLKQKISQYQTLATQKEAEEQAKIASKVADGSLSIDKALTKLEKIEEVDAKTITSEGSVSFREVQKFRIMDIVLLANFEGGNYVLPNEVAIRETMVEGKKLPGVDYFSEQIVINKRN